MFTQSAELYDLIYRQIKDYRAETRTVAELLQRTHPGVRTVLDVACGTGEHMRFLREDHGLQVDGIDLDPKFVDIARGKNPAATVTLADMTQFDLGRRYDAVVCLFSSIGYARTLDGVTRALRRFRAHLAPGGAVVVEPWFTPDRFTHGRVSVGTYEGDGVTVCRMSHSNVVDRTSHVRFEYLIGRPEGIVLASEDHELGLFTVDEMRGCFAAAGLTCEHDPEGLMGRGMYVGREA